MSLIIEDGTGLSNAESYASVAEADEYHLARGREAEWVDLDATDKEYALRRAMDYMRASYRTKWEGVRKTNTQALDWPRWNVPKKDVAGGYGPAAAYYSPDSVPTEVKSAQIELALIATTTDLNPTLSPLKTKATVGPISVEYAPGTSQVAAFAAADDIVAPLMRGGYSSNYNFAMRRG